MTGSISLVIPTYARPDRLARVLDHVAAFENPPDEVIVVAGDAASADLARRRAGIDVVEVENRNAGTSRNAGWQKASGDLVAFLDDDTMPPPTWPDAVRSAMANPKVAAAGGPITNPAPDSLMARVAQTWFDRRNPPGPIGWLASQNLVVRSELLAGRGGFDEDLVTFEDVDLTTRLREDGWMLWNEPDMAVDHEHRERLSDLWRQHRGYGIGFVQMARKHPRWDQAPRAPIGGRGLIRAIGVALVRPIRCAFDMPRPIDRILSYPVFVVREVAFLSGSIGEVRRWS